MQTLAEFLTKHQVEMKADRIESRPDGDMGMPKGSFHFLCTFKQVGKGNPHTLSVLYSMGPGHARTRRYESLGRTQVTPPTPKIGDVLDCLASDARGYDNARSFEDWASDYGYDTDSRKAYGIYQTIAEQAKKLRHFLGDEAYRELLNDTESL